MIFPVIKGAYCPTDSIIDCICISCTEFKTSTHGAYIEVVNSAVDITKAKEFIIQEATMAFVLEKVKTYTMGETYQDSMLSDIIDSRVTFEKNLRKVYTEK